MDAATSSSPLAHIVCLPSSSAYAPAFAKTSLVTTSQDIIGLKISKNEALRHGAAPVTEFFPSANASAQPLGPHKKSPTSTIFFDPDIISLSTPGVICSGCNFNFLHKYGESLWFPTIYEDARAYSNWKHLDERHIEGRRRHIWEEYNKIKLLAERKAKVLVCGAGFIGVEWVTELRHFFPDLDLTIIDFLPACLGPLPAKAQQYCDKYMAKKGTFQ